MKLRNAFLTCGALLVSFALLSPFFAFNLALPPNIRATRLYEPKELRAKGGLVDDGAQNNSLLDSKELHRGWHQEESVTGRHHTEELPEENIGIIDEDVEIDRQTTPPTRAHPPENNFLKPRQHLMHVTHRGSRVEGPFFARIHMAGPGSEFPGRRFFDPLIWSLDPKSNKKTFIYKAGGCYWCPSADILQNNCSNQGTFSVSRFGDDHHYYSLKTRGVLDVIKLHPMNKNNHPYAKANIDTLYALCNGLRDIPIGVPGALFVENMPNFRQLVNPRVATVNDMQRKRHAVCTKAFYGTMINSNTVTQFVTHYLENLKFDVIFLYELGTSAERVLEDIIWEVPSLLQYLMNGKLVLIDLRDELQRMYGPIAGDVVIFSSMNGQLLVGSDCLNRAKTQDIRWVLPIDWDEFLTFGANHTRLPTFPEWIDGVWDPKSKHPEIVAVNLKRIQPTEDSICTNCKLWDHEAIFRYHREKETLNVNDANDDKVAVVLEVPLKYIVKIGETYPFPGKFGIHVISPRAFNKGTNTARNQLNPSIDDIYMRHYRCMNWASSCDTQVRHTLNWAHDFAGIDTITMPSDN